MHFTPEEMAELSELFVQVLRANPTQVVANLNKHLETAGIELFVVQTVKRQSPVSGGCILPSSQL